VQVASLDTEIVSSVTNNVWQGTTATLKGRMQAGIGKLVH
jgi:hypothetical protein